MALWNILRNNFMRASLMANYLFTSESVGIGHPDKVCDQISDSILDACLAQDPQSKVACEAMVSSGVVFLAGEITTLAKINYNEVVREILHEIGYNDPALGFDYRTCGIISTFNHQSPDIALGLNEDMALFHGQGAGDQGIMFGYACDETPEFMPLTISLAHKLVFELKRLRETQELPYLRPDAKTQVTIEYSADHQPLRVHTIVISAQHAEEVSHDQISRDMKQMVTRIIDSKLLDDKTLYYINPTGRFVIGGPLGDCGLTGRKPIVDTYGGVGRHGGGAFSGKDPTKVDRSAAYAARYVAKNIIAAKLAKRCELQVSYAIGVPYPISIKVDTFGTSEVSEDDLAKVIPQVFDLTPKGIITMLDLLKPIYKATAFGGHFGREEFSWEKIDRVPQLLASVEALKSLGKSS